MGVSQAKRPPVDSSRAISPAVRLGRGPTARLRVHPEDLSGFVVPVGRRWPPRDFLATRSEQAVER